MKSDIQGFWPLPYSASGEEGQVGCLRLMRSITLGPDGGELDADF
jgi:hypothetical protein